MVYSSKNYDISKTWIKTTCEFIEQLPCSSVYFHNHRVSDNFLRQKPALFDTDYNTAKDYYNDLYPLLRERNMVRVRIKNLERIVSPEQ